MASKVDNYMKLHKNNLFQLFKKVLFKLGIFNFARKVYLTIDKEHRKDNENAKTFFGSLVKPGELCFDVGANLGQTIDCLSELGCRIISFEPNPYCVALLSKKYQSNINVQILPIALSSQTGTAKLHFNGTASTASLRKDWPYETEEEVDVEVSTLELMIAKLGHPDLIKIDVEGFELEVIKGLKTVVRTIVFEIHKRETDLGIQVLEHIMSMGGFVGIKATTGDHSEWLIDSWSTNTDLAHLWDRTDLDFANIIVRSKPN